MAPEGEGGAAQGEGEGVFDPADWDAPGEPSDLSALSAQTQWMDQQGGGLNRNVRAATPRFPPPPNPPPRLEPSTPASPAPCVAAPPPASWRCLRCGDRAPMGGPPIAHPWAVPRPHPAAGSPHFALHPPPVGLGPLVGPRRARLRPLRRAVRIWKGFLVALSDGGCVARRMQAQ